MSKSQGATPPRTQSTPGENQPAAKRGRGLGEEDKRLSGFEEVVRAIALKWGDGLEEFSVTVDDIAEKIAVVKGQYAAVFTLDDKTCYRVMKVGSGTDDMGDKNSMLRQQEHIDPAIQADFIFPSEMTLIQETTTADGQPFFYQYQTMDYGGDDCQIWLKKLKGRPDDEQKFVSSLILFLSRFVQRCLADAPFSVFSSDIKLENIVCKYNKKTKVYHFKHIDLDSWSVYYHERKAVDITHAVTTYQPIKLSHHEQVIKDIIEGKAQDYNLAVLQYEMVTCCLLTVFSVFGIRYEPETIGTPHAGSIHGGMPRASFIASYINKVTRKGRQYSTVKGYDITYLAGFWNEELEKIKPYLKSDSTKLSYFASFTDLCTN